MRGDHELDDGVVRLREWHDEDAGWYAASVRDPLIQRFTTDPPTLDAARVRTAIARMRAAAHEAGFLVCDSVTGLRLANIALLHDGQSGEVSLLGDRRGARAGSGAAGGRAVQRVVL